MYKAIVVDYAPKAKKMAQAIEQTANARAQEGRKPRQPLSPRILPPGDGFSPYFMR